MKVKKLENLLKEQNELIEQSFKNIQTYAQRKKVDDVMIESRRLLELDESKKFLERCINEFKKLE